MKTKLIYLLYILLISFTAIAQDSSKFNSQLKTILKTFQEKDINQLNPILAENYTIAGMPKGLEKQILPQIIQQLPAFSSYKVTQVKKEKNGTRIYLYFTSSKSKEKVNSNFLFNDKNKILEFNILDEANVNTQTITE
ncbi:hypothetical protein FUA48_14875 [Flavobacterium alkalisoli]|uniref:DUF3887 domain-containing protein n=1 Tax=Flavobacterium alkalisoli TaxID=2602769 RepID=A0A5B9FV59_9FLAO|nr:hypothetical protein [Flavobacterium alkalisoli]QEE50814.1 hypothetical protein FUA48_14875 [Flavobacterium alkalisoli]